MKHRIVLQVVHFRCPGIRHCAKLCGCVFGKDSSVNSAYFWISFRGPQGQWLPPIRLSQEWKGYCPMVSPDGKYLFYLGQSDVAAIYWINAGFIRELRPAGK